MAYPTGTENQTKNDFHNSEHVRWKIVGVIDKSEGLQNSIETRLFDESSRWEVSRLVSEFQIQGFAKDPRMIVSFSSKDFFPLAILRSQLPV